MADHQAVLTARKWCGQVLDDFPGAKGNGEITYLGTQARDAAIMLGRTGSDARDLEPGNGSRYSVLLYDLPERFGRNWGGSLLVAVPNLRASVCLGFPYPDYHWRTLEEAGGIRYGDGVHLACFLTLLSAHWFDTGSPEVAAYRRAKDNDDVSTGVMWDG